jgi:hypothetical protein
VTNNRFGNRKVRYENLNKNTGLLPALFALAV